jgi:hypothetical protein
MVRRVILSLSKDVNDALVRQAYHDILSKQKTRPMTGFFVSWMCKCDLVLSKMASREVFI